MCSLRRQREITDIDFPRRNQPSIRLADGVGAEPDTEARWRGWIRQIPGEQHDFLRRRDTAADHGLEPVRSLSWRRQPITPAILDERPARHGQLRGGSVRYHRFVYALGDVQHLLAYDQASPGRRDCRQQLWGSSLQ